MEDILSDSEVTAEELATLGLEPKPGLVAIYNKGIAYFVSSPKLSEHDQPAKDAYECLCRNSSFQAFEDACELKQFDDEQCQNASADAVKNILKYDN